VQFGIVQSAGKWMKLRGVALSLILILGGHYLLVNDVSQHIYVGDVMRVIGVILAYSTVAGLTISQKALQAHKVSQQVIIEV
jgi:hypothetical protein